MGEYAISVFPWSIRAQSHRRLAKHLIVAIRGVNRVPEGVGEYGGRYGRVDLPEYWRGNGIGTRLYRELSEIKNNISMLVLTASLNIHGEPVISEVVNFITQIPEVMRFHGPFRAGFPNWKFHPDCKLIIYGFSAGAYNALQICRSLDNFFYDYEMDEIQPTSSIRQISTIDQPRLAVDLLITVDAVKNELDDDTQGQPSWSANLARCVRWNLNYYLENPGREGHGSPNTALWDGQVRNENLHRECTHSEANEHVRERVVRAVRKVICENQRPW